MRANVGLRLRHAVAAGVLAATVVGVPAVSAGAAEGSAPTIDVAPGDPFTLEGGNCLFADDSTDGHRPGTVGVILVDQGEAEALVNLPVTAAADESGHWTVTNIVPRDLADGSYGAAPLCRDVPTGQAMTLLEFGAVLRVRSAPTPTTAPPTTAPTTKAPAPATPRPRPVKAAPTFTG
jgi:hypothetical protein